MCCQEKLYRILFIILIYLCIHYADECCINLDNWNIFQQHNWEVMGHCFVFTMITKTRPWRHIYHDIRIPRPENHDIEIPRPKKRHRDSKTKKPRNRDSGTKTPRHRETETNKLRHRNSKAFFQRTKSHDIEIPRLKNHDIEIPRPKSHGIEFLWNSDPYALW